MSKPSTKKITGGYVEQLFDDDGKLVSQKFVADHGDCEYERLGEAYSTNCYAPFDMVQPRVQIPVIGTLKADGQVEFNDIEDDDAKLGSKE